MRNYSIKTGALLAASALLVVGCTSAVESDVSEDADVNEGAETSEVETIELIAAHQLAIDTPFDQGLNKFAELVSEKTDGRVEVRVFPNAQLGNETEVFDSLQSGTVDFGIFAPGSIAESYPGITLVSMPYLVKDRDHRDRILAEGVMESIESGITEATGTEILSYFGGSQRQMFFTDPVSGVDDAQGRLLRVQPSEMLADSFGAMGFEPTVIAYTELYNALEQGVADAAENEAVYIESQAFFEPAPYILLSNHEITFRPLMASSNTWDKLGEELEALVREAADEAGVYARQVEADADVDTLKRLGDFDGVSVTEVDTTMWAEGMESIWDKYASEWDVVDTLNAIQALR